MTPNQKSNPKISLVSIHNGPSPQAVPLANAFLKSAATNSPVDITLIDFFTSQPSEECARAISETVPDAVGFSMYLWNRELCLNVADQLRRSLPGVRLFSGGPEVTANPEDILKTGAFDFIISGEGEIPFSIFCQRMASDLKIGDIPGLFLQGVPMMPPYTSTISDIDKIRSPYLSDTLDTRSYSGILWQLSRGCGFSCDFCFDSSGRSGVRRFSLERIEAELHHFALTGVSQVFVLDSTFNQDAKRAKTILRMIRRIAPRIHFHFEVRSEFIDREMAGLFAKITCSLQIGLQSSDPAVLKQVGRTFCPDDFRSRINLLNESGAVFGFDLMYGLPGDTLQGFHNSLDFALSLYPNHLDIFPLAVLPGTALHLRSGTIGLECLSTPPYTLISSITFSIDDMKEARQIASACDVFYTRGKGVAWFNGVMDVLRLKPSDFLRRFGKMVAIRKGDDFSESDFDDQDVWSLQREFLIQIFSTKRLKRFQPLVLDLVDYHYHYAAALLSPQTETSDGLKLGREMLEFRLRRSDSLQLARFNYEILDIIDVGAPDIRWMSDHLRQIGSSVAIYPRGNSVCTQSFDDSYYLLLESLDGQSGAKELASKMGIPLEKASEFLLFALKEGFVIPER
ncbi:MAG: radical SAM protein [Desulfuromonadaceae bacterium]|nr:radical SAM protein [Desulfuromonadaceae bacterium]